MHMFMCSPRLMPLGWALCWLARMVRKYVQHPLLYAFPACVHALGYDMLTKLTSSAWGIPATTNAEDALLGSAPLLDAAVGAVGLLLT